MFLNHQQISKIVSNDDSDKVGKPSYPIVIDYILKSSDSKAGLDQLKEIVLNPSEMATICSKEIQIGNDNIGLLFQDRNLCADGVLSLFSSLVHPGYKGPISTHVINFSQKPILIKEGNKIFELILYKNPESFGSFPEDKKNYHDDLKSKYINMPNSFLNVHEVREELIDKIEKELNPRIGHSLFIFLGILFGIVSVVGGVYSYFVNQNVLSIATTAEQLGNLDNAQLLKYIQTLEERLKKVESTSKKGNR